MPALAYSVSLKSIEAIFGARGFTPSALFSSGEQGAWYDPSDFDRYIAPLGSELVTNGDFSTPSDWTPSANTSVSGGVGRFTPPTANGNNITPAAVLSLVAGKTYRVTFTVKNYVAGSVRPETSGGTSPAIGTHRNANGSYTEYLVAGAGDTRVRLRTTETTTNLEVDDLSVRELTALDTATMFQDSAGTTPVTAVEQPVGLLLDKSKGLALGSERITNGGFDSTAWWGVDAGWSISGGVATNTGADQIYTPLTTLEANKRYEISFDVTSVTTSGALVVVVGVTNVSLTVASTGRYTLRAADATGGRLRFGSGAGHNWRGSIDNVTVKEIAGNHASQSTAASRPVLSARVNLLTQTDLLISPWAVFNTTRSTVAETPPIGGSSAAKLVVSSTASNEKVLYTASPPTVSAASHIASVYAKAAEMSWIYLRCDNGTATGCYFNLTAGTKGTEDAGVVGTITSVGGGWYRCTATKTLTSGSGYGAVQLASGDGGKVFGGTLNEGVLLAGADLRVTNVGVNLPAYQRVAAATDYDTSGFPLYLKFDGVDDSLATGTITPGAVNKAQVFAGVRKLSDAAINVIAELSANAGVNSGSFVVYAPSSSGQADYFLGANNGAGIGIDTPNTFTAPITNTYTGLLDVAAPSAILRINSVQSVSSTTSQGASNYGNYPLYIGRRGGSSFPFNGNLYSLVVRFSAANLTNAQIASTETYVNSKTGAY